MLITITVMEMWMITIILPVYSKGSESSSYHMIKVIITIIVIIIGSIIITIDITTIMTIRDRSVIT